MLGAIEIPFFGRTNFELAAYHRKPSLGSLGLPITSLRSFGRGKPDGRSAKFCLGNIIAFGEL
jgi:hypothetical protein